MIKTIIICQKCKKTTISFEEVGGVVTFDFLRNEIKFVCAKCGFNNVLNLGDIKSALENKTRLPRINTRVR